MWEGRSINTFMRRNSTVDADELMSQYSGHGSKRGGRDERQSGDWSSRREGSSASWRSSQPSSKKPSCRTHNTGFSDGTKGWNNPNFSKHAKDRRLERQIDEYMIRHVVARGSKTELLGNDGKTRWKFEKNGVVVISSSPDPDQVIITCFVDGYMSADTCTQALQKFNSLMEELEDALDEEMRVGTLKKHLGPQLSRVAFGVDLVRVPEDCPLLQYCAKSGYVECFKLLLESGNFSDGVALPCKQDMNILHYIAWEGQLEIFDLLEPDVVAKIADVRNKFGELPEETAWNRYLQLKYNEHVRAKNSKALDDFVGLALKCVRSRLKDLNIQKGWFMDKANKDLEKECYPAGQTANVTGGCDATFVMRHFQDQVRNGICWQTRKLKISGVDLSDEKVLKGILDCHLENTYLEVIDFDACAIGPRGAAEISDFVRDHEGQLSQLILANNPMGDEGIAILLGNESRVLTTVHKLGLSNIGLRPAGLKYIAADLCSTTPTIKKLNLDSNELTENTQSCADFAAFCESLADLMIVELSLRSTRLSKVQLCLLLEAVRVHPKFHRVSIQNVHIPEEYQQKCGPSNPLISAMSDPRCSAKYLEISHTGSELLLRMLNTAVKNRERAQDRPSAILEETSGYNTTVVKHGLTYKQVEVFGVSVRARLRSLDYQIPHHGLARVTLETENGLVDKVECAHGNFTEDDVGSMFLVRLRFVHESHRNGSELLDCKPMTIDNFAATTFRGLIIVPFRQDTQQILMNRENEISPAGNEIRRRLKDGVLSDHLATEERFMGASKTLLKRRYTIDELMLDVKMGDLFDEEVKLLANLQTPEGYTGIVHGRNGPVVSASNAQFLRSQDIDTVQELCALFRKEHEQRNMRKDVNAANGYGFWERSSSGHTFIGNSAKSRYFPNDEALFQIFMKELFTDAVKVQNCECNDFIERQRRIAIKIVEVPDSLLKESLLPDGSAIALPLGFRANASRCKWFDVSDASLVSKRMDVSKSFVGAVQTLINDGCIEKLVAQ